MLRKGIRRLIHQVSESSKKPYFLTTPIFYVNAAPHLGHLYSLVLTDAIARFQNLKPDVSVISSTGTDEHGLKVQTVAQTEGVSPLQLCDRNSKRFADLAVAANTKFTHFIRTTNPKHQASVQEFWKTIQKAGMISFERHEGWYCVSDETFYPESAIHKVVDPATKQEKRVSMETGKEVQWSSEMNYHFLLSKFQSRLIEHYNKNPNFVQPSIFHTQVLEELKTGISDLSISRPKQRLSWGIPVPGNSQQTIYVWLDALTNYISVIGYPWLNEKSSLSAGWPANMHVIGKDIIRFHCIYWPAFLMAAGLPLPEKILVHSHWTMNKVKMSKSLGNVVDPFWLIEKYGVDTIRYYLLKRGRLTSDSNFDIEELEKDEEHDLRRSLGVLLSRLQSKKLFISNELQKQWHKKDDFTEYEDIVHELIELPVVCAQSIDGGCVYEVINLVQSVLRRVTKLFQLKEPWKLSDDSQEKIDTLMLVAHSLRISGILLQPIMPTKSTELLDQLGIPKNQRSLQNATNVFEPTEFTFHSGNNSHLFDKRTQ